ncbi:kinase-like domain-containing protein [Phakopsora pachyrhizi]|nr:kinase-like domain-containing protein [Phakopsora pachyrhizi]
MSSSSSSSSSSFLSIWARGVPSDQLTPKASAKAGTSMEIDPFDSSSKNTSNQPTRSSINNPRAVGTTSRRINQVQSSSADSTRSTNQKQQQQQQLQLQRPSDQISLSSSPSDQITHLKNSHQLMTDRDHPSDQSSVSSNNTSNFQPGQHRQSVYPRSNLSSLSIGIISPIRTATATATATATSKATATATAAATAAPRQTRTYPADITLPQSDLTGGVDQSLAIPHPEPQSALRPVVDGGSGTLNEGSSDSTPPASSSSPSSNRAKATTTTGDGVSTNPKTSPRDSSHHNSLGHQRTKSSNTLGSSSNSLALPPKGLLSVKIISASSLRCASSSSRPYVVAQFDNNEFVSREPIGEEEDETKGVANLSRSRDGEKNLVVGALPRRPISINSDGNGVYCLSGQNPIWKQEVDFDVTQHESHTLRKTLHVSVYDRSVGDLSSPCYSSELGGPPNTVTGIEGIEVFLGETEIELHFDDLLQRGGWYDRLYKLTTKDSETGIASEAGEIRIQLKYRELKSKKSLTVSDFEFLKMIGRGTFGRVFQVRKKDTKRIYAMKVLSKKEVIDKKEVQHTIGERNILQQSNQCPFLLGLKFSFQSPGELFLVMDYKSGGELFHHLQKEGRFTEERARFYTAEIVLALEHLHKYNIVYRDLKPENILLDATGHIVLCDFGLSKPNLSPDELTTTFCGTTEYLAPEVLLDDHGYSKLVDFWSLGVLLFEMCCGWSPFYAEDNQQMYKNICFGKIKFPRGVIGDDGKQFVKGLLNRNPKHRLGAQNDAEDLKKHAFFKTIDWHLLETRQIVPSFKPYIDSDDSVANFDKEFTNLNIEEQLPMTIRGLGDFDENDKSDDWLKQASYHQQSQHLYAGKNSFGSNVALTQNGRNKEDSGGADNDSNGKSTPQSPPGAVPLVKGGKALKNEDENSQDHFLGFSYHGESDFPPMVNNKFGMTKIE